MKHIIYFALLTALFTITVFTPSASCSEPRVWPENEYGPYGGVMESIVIDPSATQMVYVATGAGVFKSVNGGEFWSNASDGLPINGASSLAIDPSSPKTLYAGNWTKGVFKTTNGGNSWSNINTGLTNIRISSLIIDPSNPEILYVGTGDGVFKSVNGGKDWFIANNGIVGMHIRALTIDPSNTQTIYAGRKGAFKTTDGGESWRQVLPSRHPVSTIAIDPLTPQSVYALTYDGILFKSSDGGEVWNKGISVKISNLIVIDPTAPLTVYGTTSGIFKSVNGGKTWDTVSNGLRGDNVRSLAIDPSNSQTLYAGSDPVSKTNVGGIFKSVNGGESWTAINNGLTCKWLK